MKKLFIFSILCALTLSTIGCGIKSDLEHPGGDKFPRDYPVN